MAPTRASAKSKSVHSTRVEPRIPTASRLRIPSASRPFASSSTRRAASAHEIPVQAPSSSTRYAGSGCSAATASRHSLPIVLGCCCTVEAYAGRDAAVEGENRCSRLDFDYAYDLERINLLRPRLDPGRARARHEAGSAPVRRLLPDAPRGVQDADQAEALVPGARA